MNVDKEKVSRHKALASAYTRQIGLQMNEGGYLVKNIHADIDGFLANIQGKRAYLAGNKSYLTERELACLSWLAQGKTLQETAVILHVTERTVKAHVQAAKEKLNSNNMFQLGLQYGRLLVNAK